jgi:uncharacterized membrane protein YccC
MRSSPARWFSSVWTTDWMMHSARSAIAAVASLSLAKLLRMPEAYWAAITTIVVMQSSLGATWPTSIERLAGTALGCAFGAAVASLLPPNWLVYGGGIFALGLICAGLRLDRSAYWFAGLTFTIVILLTRPGGPVVVALHRFLEVSIGIAVGLAMTALWPEREETPS